MTMTVEAIYEHGKLTLPKPLSLPDKAHVRVTIESEELAALNPGKNFAKWRGRGHLPAGKNADDYLRLTRDGLTCKN